MSDHKWFAQVAHQKWVAMNKSLRSLTKISELLIFPQKNERFDQKTDERIPNPAPVSSLLSHVSCHTFPVSRLLYCVLCLFLEWREVISKVWSSGWCLFFRSVLKIPKSSAIKAWMCVKYFSQLTSERMLKYQNCPQLTPESVIKIPKFSASITGRM